MWREYPLKFIAMINLATYILAIAILGGAPNFQELAKNTAQFAENVVSKQEFIDRYKSVTRQSQAA